MGSAAPPPPFEESKKPRTRTCAVIGGRGFLGRSLVAKLLHLGDWIVQIADSDPSLDPVPGEDDSLLLDALSSGRASYHHLDLLDASLLVKAIGGSSIVFYMDSTNLRKSDFYECYKIIVQGAKNVIMACRECQVRQLIYNSTADVVFDGSRDIWDGDESLPFQWRFDDVFTDLKAQAESLILSANNIDGLLTCALRPSNVFGPGDKEFLPLLARLAKSGLTKLILGNGDNMSDFTYCENVTHAHICAAQALDSRTVSVAGKAFFITNLNPMNFWNFLSLILEGLGYQRPMVKVSASTVWYILLVINWIQEKIGSRKYNHALATHIFYLASCSRTFNCSAAQKNIGYSAVVSMQEGIRLTIRSFSHLAKDATVSGDTYFDEQSKAEKLLGGGRVADILLWRDEKTTFTCFLVMGLLSYWFWLSGRSFASSAAQLLLLVTILFFGYGLLPPKISGVNIPKISPSCFEVQQTFVDDSVSSAACLWNRGAHHLRLLAQGQDWQKFFMAAIFLYSLKLILSQPLTMVICKAVIFAFTAFFVYEQYESEIDGLALLVSAAVKQLAKVLRNLTNSHENHGPGLQIKSDSVEISY